MQTFYVTPKCIGCGLSSTVPADAADLFRWAEGALAQDVWPDATPEWRETLISGTHAECWSNLFGDDDEEE